MVGAHVDDVRGAADLRCGAALLGAGGGGGARVVGGGRPPRAVNRPVVGLGTGVDFSLLASACRGHLVGVCLHGVSVHTVALAVVVVVRRLIIFFRNTRRARSKFVMCNALTRATA